jgi:hypothetical protein
VNKDLYTTIDEGYWDTIPKRHLDMIVLSALRLAYPGVSQSEDVEKDELHIFNSEEKTKLIKLLLCPMSGSIRYVKEAKTHAREDRVNNSNGKGNGGTGMDKATKRKLGRRYSNEAGGNSKRTRGIVFLTGT